MQINKYKNLVLSVSIALWIFNPVLVLAANNNTNANTNKNTNNSNSNTTKPNSKADGTSTVTGAAEYKGVQGSIEAYLCTPDPYSDGKDLENCIKKLYKGGIAFGAIALVFFVVLAGYFYIAGGEAGKGKAKGIIQNALVGMALLLGSFVLLNFINPSLTTYKPIQTPIFDASLPNCDEIGYEDDCTVLGSNGVLTTVSGGGAGGAKVACPGGKIVSAKGLGLRTKQADEQICEEFGKILVSIMPQLSGLDWRITDTIGSGHLSACHKAGNPYSGTCADIGLVTKTTAGWNTICRATKGAGLAPVNEADNAASDCPKYGTYVTTTGQHIHVNWRK